MKKWFLRSSVALLLFAILLSGFGCIGGGPKPIEEGSANLLIGDKSHDVTYKVFDDKLGRNYRIDFKDGSFQITIFDDNRDGKINSWLDDAVMISGDGVDIKIHISPPMFDGDSIEGRVYLGDVLYSKLAPESAEQLLEEAESIIRQLEGNAVSPPQTSKVQTSDSVKAYSPEIQSIVDELKGNYGISVEVKANFPELGKWLTGLRKAVSLLPKNVSSEITLGGSGQYQLPLRVEFGKWDTWSTGTIDPFRNIIKINTTPNPKHPFPFEYLSENGYTEEEIIYTFLHEMGHLWGYTRPGNKDSYSSSYSKVLSEEVGSPSVYGYHWDQLRDKWTQTEAIDPVEDFAESFAFYVLLPEYMKTNFPLRYNWLKDNVFQTEFGKNIYPIPSSMKARLTKPLIEDG